MKEIKQLDTVILSDAHPNKHFAGKAAFVIDTDLIKEGTDGIRYDLQFPFIADPDKDCISMGRIYQQLRVKREEITLIHSY